MNSLFPRAMLACLVCLFGAIDGRGGPGDEMEIARRITAAQVPIEKLPASHQKRVTDLLDQSSSIYSRGSSAAFPCAPAVYKWLVDNPHWGFRAWKALGSKCATLERNADGTFVGKDTTGSEFKLELLYNEAGRRIWYAEGMARPTPISTPLQVRAVLLLRFQEVTGVDGRVGVRQRAELFTQVDTKASSILGKLWGMSAESLNRKAVEQVDVFFSGMSWYISEHPDWAKTHLQPTKASQPEEARQLEELLRGLGAR
jgi:hypothetical protein